MAHTRRRMLGYVQAFLIPFAMTTAAFGEAVLRDRDLSWLAPAKEASKVNPLSNRTDAAAGGGKLFQQRCSTCHGEDGRGTTKAPDLTQPDVQAQSDGALFWRISGGNSREGMPAFSFLPAPQRWQLVLRLREIATIRRAREHAENSQD